MKNNSIGALSNIEINFFLCKILSLTIKIYPQEVSLTKILIGLILIGFIASEKAVSSF